MAKLVNYKGNDYIIERLEDYLGNKEYILPSEELIKKEYFDLCKYIGKREGVYIAGGYFKYIDDNNLRKKDNLEVDIDIYFRDKKLLSNYKSDLLKEPKNRVYFESDNDIKIKTSADNKISRVKYLDLIRYVYPKDLFELLNNFDFNITKKVMYYEDGEYYIIRSVSYDDGIIGRMLKLDHNPVLVSPIVTLRRTYKYVSKGYTLDSNLMYILLQELFKDMYVDKTVTREDFDTIISALNYDTLVSSIR